MTETPDAAVQIARDGAVPLAADRDALDVWMRERDLMLIGNRQFADLTRELARARQGETNLRAELDDAQAEVVALRAVAEKARVLLRQTEPNGANEYELGDLEDALDALPPAGAPAPAQGEQAAGPEWGGRPWHQPPAPPQGEDVDWATRRHAGFQGAIADTAARIGEAVARDAEPRPAGETG